MKNIDPNLHRKLATLIKSMGYELLGGEVIPQGRRKIFRLYIDSERGVSVDDCSRVSYQVSAMLDVEDPIEGQYNLEVSSPGVDRPLFELEHFKKHIGSRIKVRLQKAIGNRKQYQGLLHRVEGENIFLLVENVEQEVLLPFADIEKANVIGDVRL